MRTPILILTACLLALPAAPAPTSAQGQAPARRPGPVVPSFGGVFEVPDPGLPPPRDQDLKLRFDVNVGPEPGELNAGFDTVARFLNMHAQAGVPRERVKAALIIHGTAGKDTLTNDEYRKRYGKDNPNLALLDELKAAGVRIYLCGQTSASRNLPRAVVTPAATIALSAMTAHLVLEKEGFVLNPF
jgi:intracellular sulfur oxidation DsrE/DsrF family protein